MRRRCLTITALTAAVLVMASAPARAMPPWTCELSTTRPVVGEPVPIEVRFWKDAEHTKPVRLAGGILGGIKLLEFFPEVLGDLPNGRGHSQMYGQLRRIGRGLYVGHLTFDETWRYHVLNCGDRFDAAGYARNSILVQPIAPPRRPSGSKSVGLSQGRALLEVVAIVGAAGVTFLWKLSRAGSPKDV
jgi:hypothetical protein